MGTSRYFQFYNNYQKDHPHAYGDKPTSADFYSVPQGSSPRVWGQAFCRYSVTVSVRIIPTRMGTSLSLFHGHNTFRDHPHAYGDKGEKVMFNNGAKGSSPRVWGQVIKHTYIKTESRIIPTRMGTSAYLSRGKHCHKDHPHAYGDKFLTKNGYLSDEGSSPRVWGQVLSVESKILFQRIIPTRMGTSKEAYPRVMIL